MIKLLTRTNPKTLKGEKKGYLTFILHLAPHKLSGYNVCPMASKHCIMACLNLAGHGGIGAGSLAQIAQGRNSNNVQRARIRRTKMFFEDRAAFMRQLVIEISKAIRSAKRKRLTPVFRLNGTSDIRWETVKYLGETTIFEMFPRVQFYDYTKIANRKNLPSNYHLTFSLAENNEMQAMLALRNGVNVAAVFRDKATVQRYMETGYHMLCGNRTVPVCNGDESDLRFLDPRGHIVGLYAKGRAKRDASGFVRD